MTTPDQIQQQSEMGVLIQFHTLNWSGNQWTGPREIDDAVHTALLAGGRIRPYCAPGHICPHDGSAERPSWVKEDDQVSMMHRNGRWENWTRADFIPWSLVVYFIVLPEPKP